jgi:hypothetical protein
LYPAALDHQLFDRYALGLHRDGVLVRPGHHVGASAYHRLQCLGAAWKVDYLGSQPFVLEVAEAIRDGERQVVEQGLATDRYSNLWFFQRLGVCAQRETGKRTRKGDQEPAAHFHPPGNVIV